jgi:predicted DNA-binding protein YlxM (UPF0122 family)
MITKDYNEVLDNCGFRTKADMDNIKIYIKKHNWRDILTYRHKQFVENYINNDFDLIKTGKFMGYNCGELLAIFLRIESQFELFEKYNPKTEIKEKVAEKIKPEEVIKVHNPIGRTKKVTIPEKIEVIYKKPNEIKEFKANPQTGKSYKDEVILKGLERANKIKNLQDLIPAPMYKTIMELFEGLTMKEIAQKRKGNLAYLISTLVGLEKGRSKTEMGLNRLLDLYE